ncbi:MAG TPA: hypothetical protein VK657_01395, partial [Terriglobales bacterium]|nr:hypothetical protein [Terriglobales bacterium]
LPRARARERVGVWSHHVLTGRPLCTDTGKEVIKRLRAYSGPLGDCFVELSQAQDLLARGSRAHRLGDRPQFLGPVGPEMRIDQ